MQKRKQGQLIQFDGHTVVVGLTRCGKTWAVKESLKGQKNGTLFFNPQMELFGEDFVSADGSSQIGRIKDAIEQGYKVNFIPSTDLERQSLQLAFLIKSLYDGCTRDMILVVDEVHLFTAKEVKRELIRVATTGLRFGIRGVWISQRPAEIFNTLMTQSNKFVIFKTNMESNYFDRYRIPGEEIAQRIKAGGLYSYCTFDWSEVQGPFKV